MKAPSQSTEERIREAARKVFMAKGYDGTTSRDIAEASGLNVAMTNYYFRSKEKLFQLTFEDFHRKFFAKMNSIINEDIPLRKKVSLMIDHEYEMVEQNPDLPMFVMYEMRRNPNLFPELPPKSLSKHAFIVRQVKEAIAKGEMKPIAPMQLMLLITSNVQHPFMARSIVSHAFRLSESEFAALVGKHKQTVKDMLLTYLFGPEKED
ncbi:TetR/AcrR family transcriptional regulator [Hymenobacter terrenus]|uniref:TetR/AcrR family transcriptional regulator n=1 Tax=Hymenobacter terrenus TaxID=1629124 RepID=UPI000619D80E|nr:TetR/AcrR family transcriptional regulator [Hymenobacter terrenus]